MNLSLSRVETELIDLTAFRIFALRTYDAGILRASMERVLEQNERPRRNAGSGPPGRVD